MPLKFRLKGLAETFIDELACPECRQRGGEKGDQGFVTDLTRVTFDGIVVVAQCESCSHIFVPSGQKHGIIDKNKLRQAVERDSVNTGQPIFEDKSAVVLEVEKLNSVQQNKVH